VYAGGGSFPLEIITYGALDNGESRCLKPSNLKTGLIAVFSSLPVVLKKLRSEKFGEKERCYIRILF